MKTRIALCLTALLLCGTNGFSQSRRPRSATGPNSLTPFNSGRFIGVWEYASEPARKMYFKVTEQQAGRFKFVEGFEWQGNISWAGSMINYADGIYLKPSNSGLQGTFVSPNFRATHGHDIRYRITLTPQPNGQLVYSVSSQLGPEKNYATRIGGDASPVAGAPTRPSVDNWNQFWIAFRNAVRRRDRSALKRIMTHDFEWSFGGYPPGDPRDSFFRYMDKYRHWKALDQVLAQGTMPWQQGDPMRRNVVSRIAPPHEPTYDWRAVFELGPDGLWRWTAFISGD